MDKKIVAISCDIDEEGRMRLLPSYCSAISDAGAVAVVIPPLTGKQELCEWLGRVDVDGVVLSGGADVNPLAFGEKPLPGLGRVSDLRDTYELALVDAAISMGIPLLGICRGLQVINVAFGGTLVQDMKSQLGEPFGIHDQTIPTYEPVHEVELSEGSSVKALFAAGKLATNSHHHQCVAKLGTGLVASGRSADGVIEALESSELPIVAVQFHPERMVTTCGVMRSFFSRWIASLP